MSTFYKNFIDLCNRDNVSPSLAAEACGVSRSAVTKWKNGALPRDTIIFAIADWFGVSASDLTRVEGAFSGGLPEKPADVPLEAVQDAVEDNARAARRCQIIDRTAGMTLAQLEQVVNMLDVMFPAEG